MKDINHYLVRIHSLTQRDPVGNAKIINKMKRKIRALGGVIA